MRRTLPLALTSAVLLSGCDESVAIDPDNTDAVAGKADDTEATGTVFWYIDGDVPFSAKGEARVFAALELLAEIGKQDEGMRGELARETLARIDAGDVLFGSIASASGIDLWHMCKDMEHAACKDVARSADFQGTDALREALAVDLDGYMWGQNLYFSVEGERDDELLASTLVHETNHVLNVSHCSYYSDLDAHTIDQTLAYIEEFRAFFVECFFVEAAEDVDGCAQWADREVVDRGYDLSPELSTVLPDGADTPVGLGRALVEPTDERDFGALVPTTDVWPEDYNPCDP